MKLMISKKGVGFEVADKAFTLCYSTNALVEFEKISGLKATQIAAVFNVGKGNDISFDRLRQIFWAGLTDCHEGLTERQAGLIMDDLGMEKVGRLLGDALTKAFGAAPKAAVAGADVAASDAVVGDAGNVQAAIG
jgi:hypothetical protein